MTLSHPWFLFGSDLTQQFQGAMLSNRNIELVPDNQEPVFSFSHRDANPTKATPRTLGRGIICLDMGDYDKVLDVATFVRTYQRNSGLLIGSLEEIAYKQVTRTAGDYQVDGVKNGMMLNIGGSATTNYVFIAGEEE